LNDFIIFELHLELKAIERGNFRGISSVSNIIVAQIEMLSRGVGQRKAFEIKGFGSKKEL